MTDILTQIGVYKRQEVASRRTRISLGELESAIRDASPPRGFKAALEAGAKGGRLALIAEIKKASPSKGLIRAEFDPPSLASAYALGGASCLSILTDGPSFQGAETHLVAARAAVALPVLRKDFLVDPWQVMESRSLGADAILVIMALVDDAVAKDLIAEGRRLQMDVLVEVHDEDEMARAAALGADLIGVNNRDLRSFRIDLGVTGRLAVHAPDHAMLVAESGIFTPLDAETLAAAGASAMLVGESLMRQEDVAQAVRALLGAGDERTRLIRLGRSSGAD